MWESLRKKIEKMDRNINFNRPKITHQDIICLSKKS